ncbi:MAG: ArdC family protein [Dehalococcoidales bacterium]|nr:ArdC family protein [Dehalococcoidales bacterium]
MYRTPQQQTNDIIGFGMFLMLIGFTVGLVKSVATDEPEPQTKLLPMTKNKKPAVTVTCPICHKVIEIPEYNGMTRSDALKRHIDREHRSTISVYPQAILIEGGERLPPQYRDLIRWIGEPLPAYSLAVDLLPAVETEVKARRIDEVLKQLKDGVEGIQDSYQFRLFLTTMSKFHDYSIGNQILIMLQKPDAARVAGFSTWKDLGRWVKKGEKGIAILAPVMPPKQKPEERERSEAETETEIEPRPVFFKVVYVFDVSQTEGKPLPELDVPVLTGEANEGLFADLLAHMRQRGVSVDFEPKSHIDPGIKGYYSHAGIWVRPEESRAQQLKTLLHEIAHYYSEGVFHIPRQDAETIAESAAFVVGTHFGFDTGVRSFPYVALWAKDKKVLENNLGAIRRVAGTILEELERAK